MSGSFDAYKKWLAIPPEEQPPNHYRLLGVPLYEHDPDTIENAADQRMTHVRKFASGKHSALSQKLLNEISTAKVTLLNSEKKAAYDAELKKKVAKPVSAAPAPRRTAPQPARQEFNFTPSQSARPTVALRQKAAWQHPLVIGAIAVGLLAVIIIVVAAASSGGGSEEVAVNPKADNAQSIVEPPSGPIPKSRKTTEPNSRPKPNPPIQVVEPPIGTEPPTPIFTPPIGIEPPSGEIQEPVATPQPVDLLKLIDIKRDAVAGEWQLESGVLVASQGQKASMRLPVEVPLEYRLEVVASRRDRPRGDSAFSVGLIAGGNQFRCIHGKKGPASWNNLRTFLSTIDGIGVNNETDSGWRKTFTSDEPSTLTHIVTKTGITVRLNDKTVIDWQGNVERLSLDGAAHLPKGRCLFVTCEGNEFRIHKMTLTPLDDAASQPETLPLSTDVASSEPPLPIVAKKLPLPDATAQQQSLEQVQDLFKDDYAAAKSPSDQSDLAKKLLQQAVESKASPVNRFVLLRETRRLATLAGDVETALQAADELADEYDLEALQTKVETVNALMKIRTPPAQKKLLAEESLALVEEAVATDQYEMASQLIEIALTTVRSTEDRDLLKNIVERRKEFEEITGAYKKAKTAFATLEVNSDDPDANLVAGRFLCFVKDHWEQGLPMLAKGSDAELKALAEKDLAGPDVAEIQAALADGWYELAQDSGKEIKPRMLQRAVFWYQAALNSEPPLSGLVKTKVEKRVDEAAEAGVRDRNETAIYLADLQIKEVQVLTEYGFTTATVTSHSSSVSGVKVEHGLLTHPPRHNSSAHVAFDLKKQFRQLNGTVAIRDEIDKINDAGSRTPLRFRVVGDGKLLWQSSPVQLRGKLQAFTVMVKYISKLELFVDCPGDYGNAHALWIDPMLSK